MLNWQTSWERNNAEYVVERSKDLTNVEALDQVKDVVGSSNSLTSYQFVDDRPYRGTSYYRIRQVDIDGTSQTYPAESVIFEGKYGVYPNPVISRTFTLELDEPTRAVLHLHNASGNEIELNRWHSTSVSTQLSPSVRLSRGVYVLSVEERGTTRRHRIVIG